MAKERVRKSEAQRAVEKRAKLREMYPKMVGRALNAINRVGKLGRFAPTPNQVAVIGKVLVTAVTDAEAALRGAVQRTQVPSLPDS